VAALRRYRGFTQETLAEAMQELGIDWERIVVAKLESGRRGFIRVDELLGLCVILEISPTDLLVPRELKDDQPYLVTPHRDALAGNVREWVRGEDLLFVHELPVPEGPFAAPAQIIDPTPWMPGERAARVSGRYRDIEEGEE
jgi:DNA-binding Xre family transcriptional regulator